jgi:uncharacterized membrane protein
MSDPVVRRRRDRPEDRGGAAAKPAPSRSNDVIIVLAVCAVTLLGGYLLKAQCLQPWEAGHQYGSLCYNDIQPLFGIRGAQQGIFPYIHGSLNGGELSNGGIEYPVLTGVFMWLVGRLTSDVNTYLKLSALFLAPFGFLAAYLLARMTGRRALLWAAAPAIVLYSFHNWDLLVVAATVAGLWGWYRGRTAWAAVAFGVGGALKLYPVLFLAPLVLERWHRRDKQGAAVGLLAGVGTLITINLPFMLANFDGWYATYKFHELRTPNFDSMWFQGWPEMSVDRLNTITTLLLVGSFIAILVVSMIRANKTGVYPFLQVCGALLAAFLLWNKVHSPQYTLWLLPFFVVIGTSVVYWLAYTAVDFLVYVGVFRWFYNGAETARMAMKYGVWARAGLLLLLIVVFLLSPAATAPEEVEPAVPEDPALSGAGVRSLDAPAPA